MRSDYHMHTSFSLDSDFPMEEEIRVAISRGLEEICFTEHVDHLDSRGNDANITKYYNEYKRCKEIYKDQIALKFGIEFGIQPHTVHFFQEDFNQSEFDFVILSQNLGHYKFFPYSFLVPKRDCSNQEKCVKIKYIHSE